MDYLVYAYLQQGRDQDAQRVVERAVQLPDRFYGGVLGYNFAAMPARYALEREQWREAAALPLPAASAPAYVAAVTRFARGIGAARAGDAAQAEAEAAVLGELQGKLRAAGDREWAARVEAQRLAVTAWVAKAQGKHEDAVRLAHQAAEVEDGVEKHPVTPGPLLPARELEGDLLAELGRIEGARRAYELTLEREPGRARALAGAARLAERTQDAEAARRYDGELASMMARADRQRPELVAARKYLGR
jgi:tetratricopeptide (TPR) repeat protein